MKYCKSVRIVVLDDDDDDDDVPVVVPGPRVGDTPSHSFLFYALPAWSISIPALPIPALPRRKFGRSIPALRIPFPPFPADPIPFPPFAFPPFPEGPRKLWVLYDSWSEQGSCKLSERLPGYEKHAQSAIKPFKRKGIAHEISFWRNSFCNVTICLLSFPKNCNYVVLEGLI